MINSSSMSNNLYLRKIWISGSRGFLGTHLISELQKSFDIHCITNSKYGASSNQDNDQPTYVDFLSGKSIRNAIESLGIPEIFIHLGWGDVVNPHSNMHLEDNVTQSKNLINELYKAGLDKFICLGSMNEYGNRLGPLNEEMGPKGQITNYARGKIEVASFGFEKAKEMNKKFIHIRLFYTIGRMQEEGSLIRDLYFGFKKNTLISLGPCEHYRDYVSIADVVKGIRLLCDVDKSTTVNLGGGKAIKLKDFVSIFWRILGGKPEMLHLGEKPMGKEQPQPNCFASLDKLQKLTGGWKPSDSIEDGIRLTIKELDKIYSKTSSINS